jgi:hypothetical protein
MTELSDDFLKFYAVMMSGDVGYHHINIDLEAGTMKGICEEFRNWYSSGNYYAKFDVRRFGLRMKKHFGDRLRRTTNLPKEYIIQLTADEIEKLRGE